MLYSPMRLVFEVKTLYILYMNKKQKKKADIGQVSADKPQPNQDKPDQVMEKEIGGYADQGLPEPTRYNDWEVKGRCSDF